MTMYVYDHEIIIISLKQVFDYDGVIDDRIKSKLTEKCYCLYFKVPCKWLILQQIRLSLTVIQ